VSWDDQLSLETSSFLDRRYGVDEEELCREWVAELRPGCNYQTVCDNGIWFTRTTAYGPKYDLISWGEIYE